MGLLAGLASAWRLDEPTGTREDIHGSIDLVEINGPIDDRVGKVTARAVNLDGSLTVDECLEAPNNTFARIGDQAKTFAGWVIFDDLSVNRRLASKWTDVQGREFHLTFAQTANRLRFAVRNTDDAGNTAVDADNFGAPSTGVWICVFVWHDPDNDEIGIQINDTTPNVAAFAGGVQTTNVLTRFMLGALGRSAGTLQDPGSTLNGGLNMWAAWNRVLTAKERRDFYNKGKGLNYPFSLPGGLPIGALISSGALISRLRL